MYSILAKKNGVARNPIPINHAPIDVLKALGNLHRAALIPEAAPRSSSGTSPIIIDCCKGLAMFIRKALTV
jgi:hypothetical protein